jgi:hypothetical protein
VNEETLAKWAQIIKYKIVTKHSVDVKTSTIDIPEN